MQDQSPFADSLRIAHIAIQALRDAGIDESDPDFETLVASECDALERLRRMLRAARFAEADAEKLAGMRKDMQERQKRFEARAETLRAIAKQAMTALDLKTLHAPDFTASVSAGKPSLVIEDESAIPSQLCKVVRSPDRVAIRKALEAGEEIPGAALGEATPTLTIRTK